MRKLWRLLTLFCSCVFVSPRSVALAEALVALIDGAAGEGTSNVLGAMLLAVLIGVVWLCLMRERRAAERRKRFEAFMAEEGEALQAPPVASPWSLAHPRGGRQLGPEAFKFSATRRKQMFVA